MSCDYTFRQLELSPAEAAKPLSLPQEAPGSLPLVPQNYQLFIQRFFSSPSADGEEKTRILAAYAPGAGKSLTALLAAHAQQEYSRQFPQAPHVFVLGFGATKQAFQRELLRRPEFGFVSTSDILEYKRLRETGSPALLQQYEQRMRRRLSAPQYGGRFRFFGYMEFFNRLFLSFSSDGRERGEEKLYEALRTGTARINWPLVRMISGGFVACDEIHQAYNTTETNSYGLAVRVLGQLFSDPDFLASLPGGPEAGPLVSPKFLYMSGTPIGSATEVVDLLNLLLPTPVLQARLGKKLLERSDLFSLSSSFSSVGRERGRGETEKLRPGAETLIAKLAKGYTAYLGRLATGRYPKIVYAGTRVGGLHLVRCVMGKAQQAAYEEYVGETLPPEAAPLLDLSFPLLSSVGREDKEKNKSGLLTVAQAKRYPPETLAAVGLELAQGHLSGSFLQRRALGPYSAKYSTLLDELFVRVRQGGKIMLIHPLVRGSGVLLIADLLRQNGVLDEGAPPAHDSVCGICTKPREAHPTSHPWQALRFVLVHGDLEENTIRARLAAYETDNLHGQRLRIILGSKVIGQGVDFTALRYLFILSLPDSLFEYLQWVGRGARNGSHALLPPAQQQLEVLTLVSSLSPLPQSGRGEKSYEELAYARMYKEYEGTTLEIQQALFRHAVDLRVTAPLSATQGLGVLRLSPPKCSGSPSPLAFQIFQYENEVRRQAKVIRRLFTLQRIYKLEDLRATTLDPPFYVPVHAPQKHDREARALMEDVFDAALQEVLRSPDTPFRVVRHGNWVSSVPAYGAYVDRAEDAWARIAPRTPLVDITARLKQQPAYEHLKLGFLHRYQDAPNEVLLSSLEHYDVDFHQRLLEDAISYLFFYLTKGVRNELHAFYVRMLYFYYRLDLVIYADFLPPEARASYSSFISSGKAGGEKEKTWQNAFLMDSITKSTAPFNPAALDKHKPGRVAAHLLPVGHFVLPLPRLFHPSKGWSTGSIFSSSPPDGRREENDIIVGYYEKSPGSIELKFKMRSPVHKIVKHEDARLIERGYICLTCKREDLEATAAQLGLTLRGTTIRDMCNEVKLELMRRELHARRVARHTGSSVRWFYLHFEPQPALF